MSHLTRSAMLSLALLSSIASTAYAQSENLAALPPAPTVAAPAPVTAPFAPAAAQLGPEPGGLWTPSRSQPTIQTSVMTPVRISDHGGDTD